jgi:hypothetical protein
MSNKNEKQPVEPKQPAKQPEELRPEDLEQISGGPTAVEMPSAMKYED